MIAASRPAPRRLVLGGLLAGLAAACSPSPPRDVNIVIVSFDTMRADRLGTYGNDDWGRSPSPNVDGLAAEGAVFETCYAPRGQTHPALGSLLTGKYPITTGLRENGYPLTAQHTTIFEHLQAAGYQTGVFTANLQVTHEAEAWAARGADVLGDGYGGRRKLEAQNESRFQRIWDDRIEAQAADYLGRVDTSAPFAMWVHYYDVHKPYNPPAAQLSAYGMAADVPAVLRTPGDDSHAALENHLAGITLTERPVPASELRRILGLYDGAVTSTDLRLGRLIAQLEELGELESTYVIFTSDHGEELFDHNRYFFHGASIYDGTVQVPLVVRGPDVVPGRHDAVVRLIDVAPTVLDLAGLPADEAMEGVSLAPMLRGEATESGLPHAFIEWQDLIYAVSDGRHKLIWNPEHVRTRKSPYNALPSAGFEIDCLEGYDLAVDPTEQVNVLADVSPSAMIDSGGRILPAPFQPLYEALGRWLADPAHTEPFKLDQLDDADLERLKQLGYVGAGSVSGGRSDSAEGEPCD